MPIVFLAAQNDLIQNELAQSEHEPQAYIDMPYTQRQVVAKVCGLLT
jgi:hypothetical protein